MNVRVRHFFAANLILAACAYYPANAQSMSGKTIGSDRAALQQLGSPPIAQQAMGPHTVMKFVLPGGNEVSATVLRATGRIVFLETDWGGNNAGAFADFGGFLFGQTTLSQIRARLGSNGYAFKDGPLAQEPPDGGTAFFNSYEIAGTHQSVTFITKLSSGDSGSLQMTADQLGDLAKLESIILGDQDYLDTIWGNSKLRDSGYKPINWE